MSIKKRPSQPVVVVKTKRSTTGTTAAPPAVRRATPDSRIRPWHAVEEVAG